MRNISCYDSGRLAAYLNNIDPGRIAVLRDICAQEDALTETEVNRRLNLRTKVMDATALSYPDGHFHFICSNNTFEHIYAPVLRGILQEFNRVLAKEGVMSHFIDLSDHFAHLDSSISIYNFLRFSERPWRWIDNDIQPQNRLRWRDYLGMYADVGIPVREEAYLSGDPSAVARIPLADKFSTYTVEELAISHGYLIT